MRTRTTILAALAAVVCLAFGAPAGAEQVRLRTGDLLQGDVIDGDEQGFKFKLFMTGGIFRLRWDQLIEDDEKRLRDDLGLNPWEENEVPMIPGHKLTLVRNFVVVFGLAQNPDEKGRDLQLKTASGVRTYPRDKVAAIQPAMVEALEVYTSDELYIQYIAELPPETPGDHLEIAKKCVQVDAHLYAKQHLEIALEDPDFEASDKAQQARNLLTKVEVLVRAESALARRREVKRMTFLKRFDDALTEIDSLRDEYSGSPAILKVLNLDRLRRETVSSRKKYFHGQVRLKFFKVLDQLIKDKVRERDEEDEPIGIQGVKTWAQNPRGLATEIFQRIAEMTGMEDKEAQEYWESRTQARIQRYNYGPATFIHPEVRDRSRRAISAQKGGRPSQRGGRQGAARTRRGGPKLRSEQDWWKETRSSKVKVDFVKAWFAEMGGGVLQVIRIENRNCKTCAGRGVLISRSVNSADEIRTVCPSCNFAGHERIVICR